MGQEDIDVIRAVQLKAGDPHFKAAQFLTHPGCKICDEGGKRQLISCMRTTPIPNPQGAGGGTPGSVPGSSGEASEDDEDAVEGVVESPAHQRQRGPSGVGSGTIAQAGTGSGAEAETVAQLKASFQGGALLCLACNTVNP